MIHKLQLMTLLNTHVTLRRFAMVLGMVFIVLLQLQKCKIC